MDIHRKSRRRYWTPMLRGGRCIGHFLLKMRHLRHLKYNYWTICGCLYTAAWWRHQMETFSALLALRDWNPPATGGFSHKVDVFFICTWTNGWSNNRDAGDLGRHRAHYDVTLMLHHGLAWEWTWECPAAATLERLVGSNSMCAKMILTICLITVVR